MTLLERWIRACQTRREHVPRTVRLGRSLVFLPVFSLYYAILRLRSLFREPARITATCDFGARLECTLPDLVGLYLHLFGVWEPDLTAFVRRRLGPGDVFLDVGAHSGYYTHLALQRVGAEGRVIAVEASPSIVKLLQANLAANPGSERVELLNVAASDARGEVALYGGPARNIGLTTTVEERGFGLEARVPAAPLSELLDEADVARLRLVKIDVEGSEDRVLRGLLPLLPRAPESLEILVELSPRWWPDRHQTAEKLLAPFFAAGFHAYTIENDYWPWRYLWPRDVRRPRRVRAPLDRRVKRIDLVLSRCDAEWL